MRIIATIILLLLTCSNIYSQTIPSISPYVSLTDKENTTSPAFSYTALSIGIGAFIYLINPVLLYEDKKLYAGITKELSVGFGELGEHRVAFEYSFVLTGNISHHTRLSYKYDFLLRDNIKPSHTIQTTSVISAGAGYFTNFSKQGVFPELTFGYSFRNHKLLIYPHIKIRHTFMFRKPDTDITDISFGIILGIANPFVDVDIKRQY
ncbi:MAG: hypothetical protein JW917_04075 [Ignavibacteria bacterium]|nr:hypothetical protein [Ignavibacteria bacterium]